MKSHFITLLVVFLLVVTLQPLASFANEDCNKQLFPQDLEEKALEALLKQSFDYRVDPQEIKDYVKHFLNSTTSYRKVPNNYGYNATGIGSDERYTTSWGGSSEGCFHYANFITSTIHGDIGPALDHGEQPGSFTAQGIKEFLEDHAQAGEHIRIDSYHSLIFISSDEKGFYTLEYNGDYRDPYAAYNGYEYFADFLNQLGREFYIYDSHKPLKKPGNLDNNNFFDSYGSTPQWNLANRKDYLEHKKVDTHTHIELDKHLASLTQIK